jgi:hypothetical protein
MLILGQEKTKIRPENSRNPEAVNPAKMPVRRGRMDRRNQPQTLNATYGTEGREFESLLAHPPESTRTHHLQGFFWLSVCFDSPQRTLAHTPLPDFFVIYS